MGADIFSGRLPFLSQHIQGVNEVEYEIFQKGLWQCGLDPSWLSQYVKRELRAAFGKLQEEEEVVFGPPPPPLGKDCYIQRIAGCMVKYMPDLGLPELDSAAELKLLGSDGMLIDFSIDAHIVGDSLTIGHGERAAQPEASPVVVEAFCKSSAHMFFVAQMTLQDRLWMRMPPPLPEWLVDPSVTGPYTTLTPPTTYGVSLEVVGR